MEFSISKKNLLECLNHFQSVVEKRNTIPILSNIKLIVDETNGLELQFVISDGGMQVESALNNHSTGSSTHNKQPSWAFAGDFKPKFVAF